MNQTTDTTTTVDRTDRFEDRLLDALLAEFDAPAAAPPLPGPTGSRRQTAATWLAAAAAVALLAGATWMFTGGLDPDEAPVTVAAGPTTATAEPVYLLFPEEISPAGTSVSYAPTPAYDVAGPTPVSSVFRAVGTDVDRPLVYVTSDPATWRPPPGTELTSPGGIVVVVPDGSETEPVVFASWKDAESRVLTVGQGTSSALSAQTLQLLSTDELLELVDHVAFDGSTITLADDGFVDAANDPNGFDRGLVSQWTTSSSIDRPGGGQAVSLVLTGSTGETDLSQVPGRRVAVRGTTGVLGATSSVVSSSTSLVWNEDGATFSMAFSGPGASYPGDDEMVASAAALQRVTQAEFTARVGHQPTPTRGGLRLTLPEDDAASLLLRSMSLDADGASTIGSGTYDAVYQVANQRWVDLMVTDDAETIVVWRGDSPTPPACALHIDVSDLTAGEPMRATLDPTCTG